MEAPSRYRRDAVVFLILSVVLSRTARSQGNLSIAPVPQHSERVRNAFAPNARIASLDIPHALRPSQLLNPPLSRWIADVFIRDALETGEKPEEIKQGVTRAVVEALSHFSARDGFFVRKEKGLWVSNGHVGLRFAEDGMTVASFYDLTSGTEAISRNVKQGVPWKIVWLTTGDPAKTPAENYRDIDLFHHREDTRGALARFIDREEVTFTTNTYTLSLSTRELKLSILWKGATTSGLAGDFDFRINISLTRDSPIVLFRASVENRVTNAGIVKVYAPWLRNFGYRGECDTSYSWGCGRGYRFVRDTAALQAEYPSSRWSMQFLCVGMGNMTMYLANHDPLCCTKDVQLLNGSCFGFGQFVENTGIPGNALHQRFDVAIGPVQGTWYDAAKLYRKWAIKQPFCSEGPLLARSVGVKKAAEVAFWVRPGYQILDPIEFTYRKPWEIEKFRRYEGEQEVKMNLDFLGPEKLGLHWYKWYREPYDELLPAYTPHENIGEVFTKYSNMGIVQLPYMQAEIWDPKWEPAKAAFPDRCVQLGGGYFHEEWSGHGPDFWVCPSAAIKVKKYVELVQRLKTLGARGAYLDCFTSRIVDCYNPAHHHPKGIGGSWYCQAQRNLLEEMRRAAGADFAMAPEYFVESYIDKFSAFLSSIWVESMEAPLIPAVYSGYATIFGCRSDEQDDPISFRIRTGRVLLWGGQLGSWMMSYYLDRPDMKMFMKRCVEIKRAASAYLNFGEMLRPPEFINRIPAVQTTMWKTDTRREDGKLFDAVEATLWKTLSPKDPSRFLLLVNYDDSPHEVNFSTKGVVSAGEAVTLRRVDSDGKKAILKSGKRANEPLSVTVPAASPLGLIFEVTSE